MKTKNHLDVFLNPSSLAVIGASERLGSWGSRMIIGLQSYRYPGDIYPVNPRADRIFGLPAYKDIQDVEEKVELAILTIPPHAVKAAIAACGKKGVKGIIIITAGYSEADAGGREKERQMAELAHAYGMRLVGPNVSGIFNLHADFLAAAPTGGSLLPTPLAAISQGGFALYDLFASAFHQGMGVGCFVHTGNECDLTVTDFLEYLGDDPGTKAIVMYLETLRDGRRFIQTARRIGKKKPVVVHKAGFTAAGLRAAGSHTGALVESGKELFLGALRQAGVIISPSMELLIPLGHALVERPPMRGRRVGVITLGGSWGVALTDALEEEGLIVPELSPGLQKQLQHLGMPQRASTKNPVDFGAAGLAAGDVLVEIARHIITSGDVDALVMHGLGRPSGPAGGSGDMQLIMTDAEKQMMRGFAAMEKELGMPVILGAHHVRWVCESIDALAAEGVRFCHRLDETAQMLSLMHRHFASLSTT